MVTIYGLFEGERCVYVGRTKNPEQRRAGHANKIMKGRPFELRPLRVVKPTMASRAEATELAEWRAKGMAELNGTSHQGLPHDLNMELRQFCEGKDMKPSQILKMSVRFTLAELKAGRLAVINGRIQLVTQ